MRGSLGWSLVDEPLAGDSDGYGRPDITYPRGLDVDLCDGRRAETTGIGWTDCRGQRNVQLRDEQGVFASRESHLTPRSILMIQKHQRRPGTAA